MCVCLSRLLVCVCVYNVSLFVTMHVPSFVLMNIIHKCAPAAFIPKCTYTGTFLHPRADLVGTVDPTFD